MRPAAFSLVEVLLAIGILAIGVLTVASLLPVAIAQQKAAADDVLGTNYGLSVLEVLKAQGKDDQGDPTGSVTCPYPFVASGATTSTRQFLPVTMSKLRLNYADPNNIFNYSVAYRRPTVDGPVEVAVFVYRQPGGSEAVGSINLTQYTCATGTYAAGGFGVPPASALTVDSHLPPNPVTPSGGYINLTFNDQLMMVQDPPPASGPNNAFVIRVANKVAEGSTYTAAQLKSYPPASVDLMGTAVTFIACGNSTSITGANHPFKTVAIVTGIIP